MRTDEAHHLSSRHGMRRTQESTETHPAPLWVNPCFLLPIPSPNLCVNACRAASPAAEANRVVNAQSTSSSSNCSGKDPVKPAVAEADTGSSSNLGGPRSVNSAAASNAAVNARSKRQWQRLTRAVCSRAVYSGMLCRSVHMRSRSKPSHASCTSLMRLGVGWVGGDVSGRVRVRVR